MKNTVACCYLTYNHPEVIDEVLGVILKPYSDRGIDIYVYDSSEKNDTELIVNKYQNNGFEHLYYVDVRFITSGDAKLLYVIQGNGLNKHYDYIWPTKDRCFFLGETLDNIVKNIQLDYDVVFAVNEADRWELRVPPLKDVYDNPVEFFSHYGQLSTNWEAMIRRTDTMVDPVDWDYYISKYNLGAENNFNQLLTIFARLSELKDPKVRVIHHPSKDKFYSTKAFSMWRNQIAKVWLDTWIPAINSLPEIYDEYKKTIIKSELGLFALFGSSDAFLQYGKTGIISKERFEELKLIWDDITDFPLEYAEYAMNGQEDVLMNEVVADLLTSFTKGDFDRAYYLYYSNRWLVKVLKEKCYNDLGICFGVYKNEINEKGHSELFSGVTSLEDLLVKYYRLTGEI